MTKKVFRNLVFVSIFLAIFAFCLYDISLALAADSNDISTGLDTVAGASGAGLVKSDLKLVIGKIIKVILGFLGVIALGLVLYGGYLYMTSGGEPDKVNKAKQWIINAGIGLAIILLSYAIVSFVISKIQGAVGDATYMYACSDGKDNDGDGAIDFPADGGCQTATYYTEYSGFKITGGSYLRATGIVPTGQQRIVNVHPRIAFNQAVLSNQDKLKSNITITTGANASQTVTIKPSLVTEANGKGEQILNDIKEDDDVSSADWIVCNDQALGTTPMTVEYDMTGHGSATEPKIHFESAASGEDAKMTLSCSKDGAEYFDVKTDWIPDAGNNLFALDAKCLGGEKLYIKFSRTGASCLKFDYIHLEVTESLPPSSVNGSFVLKNGGRLVEFVPEGTCDPANPDAYSLKRNTEYTVTLKDSKNAADGIGLQSADGDFLLCNGAGNPCTATFTTGEICDVTAPQVNFNALNKSICQFPEASPDTRDIPFQAEDDGGLSVISFFVDHKDGEEDAIDEIPLPEGPLDYSASFPWLVNDYSIGTHYLRLYADDVDGNHGSIETPVYLRPASCCDEAGNIKCGPPECGACEDGPCQTDADCADGFCEDGICKKQPVINNVNPKEGIDGNFVTILGSGFGTYVNGESRVMFSAGVNPGEKYTLPAELGCDPKDAWKDWQIIAKVPAGIGDAGPIKVITSRKDKDNNNRFDDTEDDDGWQGDFTKNPALKYPGLCSMNPVAGAPGTLVTLGGEKFGTKDDDDNTYVGSAIGVVTGSWADTSITGVRMPQIEKGIYDVRVGKGEKCQKVKENCAVGEESCLVDCEKDSANCNCYDVMSNPLPFELQAVGTFPNITEITPKVCAIGGAACEKGPEDCICVSQPAQKVCTKTTQVACEAGSADCICDEADPPNCTKEQVGACQESAEDPECICVDQAQPDICKTASVACDEGEENCICQESAPVNQIISVLGNDFGATAGQVILKPIEDDGHGGWIEATDDQGNLEPAFIATLACGPSSWSDTQILVKVPADKMVQGDKINITTGHYFAQVITNQSLPSNTRLFVVNDNAPGPGICSISPNNGPVSTKFTLTGENFKTKDVYDLSFFKNKTERAVVSEAGNITWADKSISNAMVPGGAVTGGVMVHSADKSIKSNTIDFRVGACKNDESCLENEFCCSNGVCTSAMVEGQSKPKEEVCKATVTSHESEYAWIMSTGIIPKIPAVIERTCFVTGKQGDAGYRQSTSPVKDEKAACPNGMISATFNMIINTSSLNNHIIIRRCTGAAGDTPCDFSQCTGANGCVAKTIGTVNPNDIGTQPSGIECKANGAACQPGSEGCVCSVPVGNSSLTSFSLDTTYSSANYSDVIASQEINGTTMHTLFPNSWYQVEIVGGPTSGITSPAGKVMPQSYVWSFKTRADNCVPDKFLMTPARGKITSVQEVQQFWVTGMYQCQEISLADKPWQWTVPEQGDAQKAEPRGYACKVQPAPGQNPYCPVGGTSWRDRGVFAVKGGALTCFPVGCSQFNDGCECTSAINLETTPENFVDVLATAVVPESTIPYQKGGELEINFSEPRVVGYYPNCDEACINAQLGANFNTKMKETVVEDSANIKLYSCETKECTTVTPLPNVSLSLNYQYVPTSASSKGENVLHIDLANQKNLLPNKYHRVVISGAVESISGVKLVDLNYHDKNIAVPGLNSFSWVFKTKNDPNECVIDTIAIEPDDYVATQPAESINYAAVPRTSPDKCNKDGQILNPLDYPWTWSTNDTDSDIDEHNGIPLAVITHNVYNISASTICTDKCILKGSITYRALCGNGIVETGEECDYVDDDVKMKVGANTETVTGVTCNHTSCLLEDFIPCTPENITNEDANCCGNGKVNEHEECDLGAAYLNKKGEACTPPGTEADPCVLVPKSKACTAGCLNAGTAEGYVCGNGVKEAGEDADASDNKDGDGIDKKCLNEGAQAVYSEELSVCGNGTVDKGEECDSANPLCSDTCLVTGYPLCANPNDANCCGNGNVENINGLGSEQCEKTACYIESNCPTQEANMDQCKPALTAGCHLEGQGAQETCICAEPSSCGANGKVQTPCNKGDQGCVCNFPAWCNNNCTNKGSNINYGSLCGNGQAENGEDAACEADVPEEAQGSPYQKATINEEENQFDVYSVILRLQPDPPENAFYSLTKNIIAQTTQEIAGQDQQKQDTTDITLRVPESVYKSAVEQSCDEPTNLNAVTVPANNSQDVCRNVVLVLSTPIKEITGGDDSVTFYYRAAACPEGKEIIANPLAYESNSKAVNWFVNVYEKIKEFVRSLLFKVGLAANPNDKYCRGPEVKPEIKVTASGTEMRAIPTELLLPGTEYGIVLKNLKNKCNDSITPNPYSLVFTTGAELCRLNNIIVTPADLFVMQSNQNLLYQAYPKSDEQDIFPVPGVYSWSWGWESTDTTIAEIADKNGDTSMVSTHTKNGQAQIKAIATITADNVGQVCVPAGCVPGTNGCNCVSDPGAVPVLGAKYTGIGNLKIFICDNPWFGDVYGDFSRSIPPEYQYSDATVALSEQRHKKFDLRLEQTNDGQLKPSYLWEKEFNAGLFYCRDFGKPEDLTDDLPLVGLQTGAFTEVDPKPRFGIYVDRNFDYVRSGDSDNLSFMNRVAGTNTSVGPWTISAWVYNDDLPQDRYVRLFYKNLTGAYDAASIPNQDHVQLGIRNWCAAATPTCWMQVINGDIDPEVCSDQCTAENIKRSVVFKLKYGNTVVQKGVQGAAGLLNKGFNQITLSYDNGDIKLHINGIEQCNIGGACPAQTLADETVPMFVWPRKDVCKTAANAPCNEGESDCTCVGEEDDSVAYYDDLFIGGLGLTKVPLVSFGGYIDDFRVFNSVRTPAQIQTDPESGLKAAWTFDNNTESTNGAGRSHCTADYTAKNPPGCNVADPTCTVITSQCIPNSGNAEEPLKFKHFNITNIAKEKGIFYGDNSGWKALQTNTENQCNNNVDDDNNGLIDYGTTAANDYKCTSVNDGWEEPALFAQYFFIRKNDAEYPSTNDNSPDAISLRIFENPESLPPALWYAKYVPNPATKVPDIKSDCMVDGFGEFCYAGIQDGRTIYITASNLTDTGTNVYNNIYLLSYSQNSNVATQNIFGQMVQFLKFNMNKLDNSVVPSKIKVIRDTKRLQDFVLMHEFINVYKSQHGGQVPQLESGTLQRHKTFSTWESWSTEFPQELGQIMPTDPINALYNEVPSQQCSTTQGNYACAPGDPLCVCDDINKNVPCGNDIYGNPLACLSTQQCVIPGAVCVDCEKKYDAKACYNSSTQSFASLYSYFTNTALPNYGKNYVYSYEANGNDAAHGQFKIGVSFEEKGFTYKYVPLIDTQTTGWDQLKVDEAEPAKVLPGATPECRDGVDNDRNGKIDYPNDPGCQDNFNADGWGSGANDPEEDFVYECNDTTDNDSDGTCDYSGCCSVNPNDNTTQILCQAAAGTWKSADPSCSSLIDADEYWPTQCSDNKDNDGDGYCDFGGCTCLAPNQYCKTGNPANEGTVLPADTAGCTEAADDNEAKLGTPNGNILFAFFVDNSGSMQSNDFDWDHLLMIKSIVNGMQDGADFVPGISSVLGAKAHFVFSASTNVCTGFSCTVQEKALNPVDDNFNLNYPITSNQTDGTSSINRFISFLNTPGHPYSYISHSDMPVRIMKFIRKTISLYDTENSDGDQFNYAGLAFILFTDASDADTGITYRQAAVNLANGKKAPIHMVYIGVAETRLCSNDIDDDDDGKCDFDGCCTVDGAVNQTAQLCSAAGGVWKMADLQCDSPLNNSETQAGFYGPIDYTYYMRNQNAKFRGIYQRGTMATLKNLLPEIIAQIATAPPEKYEPELEKGY